MMRPPQPPRRPPLPPMQVYCPYCHKPRHRGLGCQFCGDLQTARRAIEEKHPGTGLAHQNLVKLAGHLAAGMNAGYVQARKGGFRPTRKELDQAAAWALERFTGILYVLPEKPNGSMTEKNEEGTF